MDLSLVTSDCLLNCSSNELCYRPTAYKKPHWCLEKSLNLNLPVAEMLKDYCGKESRTSDLLIPLIFIFLQITCTLILIWIVWKLKRFSTARSPQNDNNNFDAIMNRLRNNSYLHLKPKGVGVRVKEEILPDHLEPIEDLPSTSGNTSMLQSHVNVEDHPSTSENTSMLQSHVAVLPPSSQSQFPKVNKPEDSQKTQGRFTVNNAEKLYRPNVPPPTYLNKNTNPFDDINTVEVSLKDPPIPKIRKALLMRKE